MTDRLAIFGNPVQHSKSPQIYHRFAEQAGIDLTYERIEAPLDGFHEAFMAFRASGARGGNITAPFKLDAYAASTKRMREAEIAGACNTYKFVGDDILVQNTDGIGLVNDIQQNLNVPLEGKRILILGAGGAVRGCLAPFLDQKPGTLTIANRTLSRADDLAARFAGFGKIEAVGLDGLDGRRFDVVLNATSAALSGQSLALPASIFREAVLAYDLNYGKGKTPFLKSAEANSSARLADGVGMLAEQAVEAFAWWYGTRPDSRAVIEMLTVPLV
ncbi:MAG: shikimate dehydrogenase [Proteobacteria bacterium]|nr:shikimate dehydrogenase [Pseudomonadota bacterium]